MRRRQIKAGSAVKDRSPSSTTSLGLQGRMRLAMYDKGPCGLPTVTDDVTPRYSKQPFSFLYWCGSHPLQGAHAYRCMLKACLAAAHAPWICPVMYNTLRS